MNRVHVAVAAGVVVLIALVVWWRRGPAETDTPPPAQTVSPVGNWIPNPLPSSPSATDSSVRPAPTPVAVPVPLTPSEEARLTRTFKGFLKAHAAAVLEHGLEGSLFKSDRLLFRREARLFAAAYPDLADSLATSAVREGTLDWRERLYAIEVLGYLADTGRSSVLPLLRTLSSDENEFVKDFALAAVAMADVDGSDKALYWTHCREGSATAFAFVSLWPDSGTISEMHALESTIYKQDAVDVLKKIEILQKPDWKEHLGRIVRGERQAVVDPVDWALGCLQRRAPEQLRTLLRAELDATGERARRWWTQQKPEGSYEKDFQAADSVSFATGRKDYDLLLVTQWLIGGELTDVERRRLREFGYASDPAARLAELLAAK